MRNIISLFSILMFFSIGAEAQLIKKGGTMADSAGGTRPILKGGTGIATGTTGTPAGGGVTGRDGNCCIQANPATNPADCTQSTPASSPPLSAFLPFPATSPGYQAAYTSQYNACQTLAPKCKWNANSTECAAPRPPVPTPTPKPADQCLSKGGSWCSGNSANPNFAPNAGVSGECGFPSTLPHGTQGCSAPGVTSTGAVAGPGGCNNPGFAYTSTTYCLIMIQN